MGCTTDRRQVSSRRLARLGRGVAVIAVATMLLGAADPTDRQERVRWQGSMRTLAVHLPAAGATGAPLLLALGDPGRSARYALGSWRELADREGFAVAAISSLKPDTWLSPQDGPGLLRAVVQQMKTRHGIDSRRVYIFGAGAGAGFAVTLGAVQPEYFAAVAGFGGPPQPQALAGNDLGRSLPMRLFYSKRTPKFDVDDLAQVAAAFRQAGADVTLEQLDIGPDFERRGRKVAARIWAELAPHALSEAPRYRSSRYGD